MNAVATPTIRRPRPLPERLPRYWMRGSAVLSHRANALNLLFPAGERFFVRSVRHYLDRVDDPALLARVRGFIGQEAQHGRAHEAAFEILERQGYDIQAFLRWYEWLGYEVIEPNTSPELRLAVTVALEHITASLAEAALEPGLLDDAHPAMVDLLRWHAAEEIEHKSVAFDVLQAVDDRYALRVAGMAVATIVLLAFWTAGTAHLLRQDPWIGPARRARELSDALVNTGLQRTLRRAWGSWLKPGFHPDDVPNDALAEAWLRAHRPGGSHGGA